MYSQFQDRLMSQDKPKKVFSIQGFDIAHYKKTDAYTRKVNNLFKTATAEVAYSATKANVNPDKPFTFDDYPKVKSDLVKTLSRLTRTAEVVITQGTREQWLFASKKNDAFLEHIQKTSKIPKARLEQMQDHNLDALKTFQGRKVGGMNLSQRVWKYTEQFRDQLEVALDVGLGEGRSAHQLATELQKHLQDPDRLFRSVRDKRGNLQLSKAAKAFHPGRGVYRSSYKNAMRLVRSEINMAYREADYLRWQAMDFVVGFEIHRSNREHREKCRLCDRLKGKYPKAFKFVGWHPQCMCYMTPIIQDEEDYVKGLSDEFRAVLRGEDPKAVRKVARNEVKDVPEEFKAWILENQEKQEAWASTPYFIRDNFVDGDLSKGLRFISPPKPLTAQERAKLRHESRTPEQIQALQKRWDERRKLHKAIRQEASAVLKLAKGYSDVDFEALEQAVQNRDLKAMQTLSKEVAGAIEAMKKREEAIAPLIPNVQKWHKQFSMDELEAVHKAVEAKLEQWGNLSLQEQQKKLSFEVDEYFGTNKYGAQDKYKTWQVAQEAYKVRLEKVQYKIDKQAIEVSSSQSISFAEKTKSAKVKQLALELKGLLAEDTPISELQSKADALNKEVAKLESAKLARNLKKGGNGFAPEDYTQERKDKAVWDKGDGKVADKTLIDIAAKNWASATEAEKDRVHEYTRHYCNINEPLQGRRYLNPQKKEDFVHRVENITSYISKNRLPEDMWFQRGDDGLGVIASRIKFAGGTMPSDLQKLVGMTMQEGGFMSTGSRKGKGFSNKSVIINVYAPKGTQAAYLEPFSYYGNGAGRNWDGKKRFTSFSSEHETLFQRGTLMRITKVYQEGAKTFIDCEVIGQEIKKLSYVKDSDIGY